MTTRGSQLDTEAYAYSGAESPSRAGRVINDRYEVRGVVGRGGVADVVRAHDRLLNRDVAIKLFRAGSLLGDDVGRIEAESRILAGLNHPHLIAVFDAGVETDADGWSDPFLVLEHVDGPTLAELIATGPIALQDAARLAEQLAGALAYMHERAIVHRDVKPSNILLAPAPDADGTWHAKLTDFGIARVLGSAPLTQQGLTVGTPNYLSPEQVRGQAAGPASDVFALGLVLLEVATGTRVYDGTGPEVVFARLDRPPTVPPEIPTPWADLLRSMTAADPAARPSATGVAKQAKAFLDPTQPVPIRAVRPVPRPQHLATALIGSADSRRGRGRSTRARRLVSAGVAALAMGAIGGAAAVVFGLTGGAGESPAAPRPPASTVAPASTPNVTRGPSTTSTHANSGPAPSVPPRPTARPAASTVAVTAAAVTTADPTPTGQASDRSKPPKTNGHGRGKGLSKSPDR